MKLTKEQIEKHSDRDEQRILYDLVDAWNTFAQIETDSDRLNDFRYHIHAIQLMIVARNSIINMQ